MSEPTMDAYKLGPRIPISVSRLREGCMWCGQSLEHAETFALLGTEYAHGRLPTDCPPLGNQEEYDRG